jgi:hypothetical protein
MRFDSGFIPKVPSTPISEKHSLNSEHGTVRTTSQFAPAEDSAAEGARFQSRQRSGAHRPPRVQPPACQPWHADATESRALLGSCSPRDRRHATPPPTPKTSVPCELSRIASLRSWGIVCFCGQSPTAFSEDPRILASELIENLIRRALTHSIRGDSCCPPCQHELSDREQVIEGKKENPLPALRFESTSHPLPRTDTKSKSPEDLGALAFGGKEQLIEEQPPDSLPAPGRPPLQCPAGRSPSEPQP